MIRASALCVSSLLFAAPAFAQSAADDYYDHARMASAREALSASHGRQTHAAIMAERLEVHSNDSEPVVVWDGQAWVGGDLRKLWFKTEGEYSSELSRFEDAEIQALFSNAISAFWDLQLGVRFDAEPGPSRTHAAIGVQGLAPHWFEIDAALFLSDQGVVSARFEAEYDLRLSNSVLLQPRIELNAAFSDDPDIGLGAGLSTAEVGLRLRYEFTRKIAPYAGLSWGRAFGTTEDFQNGDGAKSSEWSLIAGLRFWF